MMAVDVPPPLQLQQYVAAPDPTQPPRFLGKGQYCVFLYRDTVNDRLVAIKRINLQDPDKAASLQRDLPRELRIHHGLNHPLIVKMLDAIVTPGDGYINIVMEYVEGGILREVFSAEYMRTRTTDEHMARWFFQQLIVTLDYLHAKKVVHRDIKLENTLCQPVPGQVLPNLKVADFGLSRTGEVAGTDVGTTQYKPPEVYLHEGNAAHQNPGAARYASAPVDVWSAGVLLYAALNMRYPFQTDLIRPGYQADVDRYLRGPRPLAHHPGLSPACMDLIEQMLRPEPAARITLPGIMAHPWFRQGLNQQDPGLLQLKQQCLGLQSPCALSSEQLGVVIARADQILAAITGVHAVNNVAA